MTNTVSPIIDDRLLYRRQFFLSPRYIENLPAWKRVKINENYFLTIHPDLDSIHIQKDNTQVIALGFLLDPYNPDYNDEQIINNLLEKSDAFQSLVKNTYHLSGRWIIIYINNNDVQLFHDAAGSRQIFYCFHESGVWCASQPHTIAQELDIAKSDNPDLLKFINSKEFEEDEHCMVGDGTLYDNIYHLMPNHSLSLNERKTTRYWPDKPIPKLSIEEASDKIAELFVELYESANNRFDLMQSVTAGVDSRALLAASKNVSKDIAYFIQKFDKLNRFSPDIRVPKKYLPKLGLDFHINNCKEYDDVFEDYLNRNVYMIQSEKKKVLYYNFFKYFQGKVNVSGNIGGIIRHTGYNHFDGDGNAQVLAKLFFAEDKKYVLKAIQKWLDTGVIKMVKDNNIYLKDIFYWEHRGANWIPMFQTELDIAIEEWNPANCRELIIASFAVSPDSKDSKERTELYKLICEKLWPETLTFPVSPPDYANFKYFRNQIRKFVYKIILSLHLLPITKKIKNAFKK